MVKPSLTPLIRSKSLTTSRYYSLRKTDACLARKFAISNVTGRNADHREFAEVVEKFEFTLIRTLNWGSAVVALVARVSQSWVICR